MTPIERKSGKPERIQKLLKNIANIRSEPVKTEPSVIQQPNPNRTKGRNTYETLY